MMTSERSAQETVPPPRELTGRTVLVCLVAFFAVVAGVNAIMIRAAVSTFGGVETQSSYRAGLQFAKEIAASRAQDARDWRVQASVTRLGDRQRIEIAVRDATGRTQTGLTAAVALAHPTDRRQDRRVDAAEVSPGRFAGTVEAIEGQRDLAIELMRGEERVFRSKSRIVLK
ncbi:MAG: FixH family protein [Alphaproteobacteria bacterium]|nr:FixH family protein [Alphaproteobacteria bacterium]